MLYQIWCENMQDSVSSFPVEIVSVVSRSQAGFVQRGGLRLFKAGALKLHKFGGRKLLLFNSIGLFR